MNEQTKVEKRIDFDKPMTIKQRIVLVEILSELQGLINFRVSSRGWCYLMETRMPHKTQNIVTEKTWLTRFSQVFRFFF